jgi:ribosome recycling factor
LTGAASLSTPDARTLAIRPFEKKMIGEVEKAIRNSNLGFNPTNDGETIRVNIPMLTEERRRDLMKKVKAEIETAKINIRNIRQDANNSIKKLKNDGVSEDDVKKGEERCQTMTNSYVARVESILVEKEKDIMSV